VGVLVIQAAAQITGGDGRRALAFYLYVRSLGVSLLRILLNQAVIEWFKGGVADQHKSDRFKVRGLNEKKFRRGGREPKRVGFVG
jgi:hypothetical protein